jgi:hypothetical protein
MKPFIASNYLSLFVPSSVFLKVAASLYITLSANLLGVYVRSAQAALPYF